MTTPAPAKRFLSPPTLAGIAAILIWASCVSVARRLSESLGVFTSAGLIFLIAGVVSLAVKARKPASLRAMFRLPLPYLLWCGALFVYCQIGLYGSLGVAVDRLQVLEVGAVNYLWPAMTLLIGVPVLKLRANPLPLAVGCLVACAGVFAVTLDPQSLSPASSLARFASKPAAYLLAFTGALAWSAYSSLARRLLGTDTDAVPLFLLASGIALIAIRLFVHEETTFSPTVVIGLAYAGLFVAWGAYALWDTGIRNGDFALLSALSYAIPVLSTLLSCLILDVRPSFVLWVGVVMVAVGAVVCRWAVRGG